MNDEAQVLLRTWKAVVSTVTCCRARRAERHGRGAGGSPAAAHSDGRTPAAGRCSGRPCSKPHGTVSVAHQCWCRPAAAGPGVTAPSMSLLPQTMCTLDLLCALPEQHFAALKSPPTDFL